MTDFIREVNEEYRRDRVLGFFVKYRVALIVLVLAVIVGTVVYRAYLSHQTQSAEAANGRYEAATELARGGKSADAQAAFDAIQRDGPAGYAALSRLRAVETLLTRDPAAAGRGFAAIAGDSGIDSAIRQLAEIRGAMLDVDTLDPKAFEARYASLATDAFAFRASLRELLALAALDRNDEEAAGRWLDEIIVDPAAPAAVRRRAEALLGLVAAGPAKPGTPEAPKPVLIPPTAAAPAVTTPATPPAQPTTTPTSVSPQSATPSQSTAPAATVPLAAAPPAAPPPAAPPSAASPPAASSPAPTATDAPKP